MAGMFQDLDRVLDAISKEKNIPREKLIEVVEAAILTAARKKWGHFGEMEAHYDEENGEIELFQFKTVVEEIQDKYTEMLMDEAKKLDPDAQNGDSIGVKLDASFGRIAAQSAKQVIVQKLRDAEREIIFNEFKDRIGELITGVVRRTERNGDVIVDIGRTESAIPKKEQEPGERYKNGERLQGYFLELAHGAGPQVILSRSHPMFVKKLFEMEVPEINEGIVEIKNVAREAGSRTKIAVYSRDSDVDPVGACVGRKGSRVQAVVQELRGEKIDIVQWDEDPARFACNAIAPAEVTRVVIKNKDMKMEVVVPNDQLSLAIGKRGQNVRLAAQLIGWDIDVFNEKTVDELTSRHKTVLSKVLGVDDSIALILHGNGYRTYEDIAETKEEEFLKLSGMNADSMKNIYKKALEGVEKGVTSAEMIAEMAAEEDRQAAVEAKRVAEANAKAKAEEEAEAKIAAEAAAEAAKAAETTETTETTETAETANTVADEKTLDENSDEGKEKKD